MAKGIFAGMTDYNHQSFTDILGDLEAEQKSAVSFRDSIEANLSILTNNGYWRKSVPNSFKSIIAYSIKHFNTTISELDDIRKDMLQEVKEHHITRLKKLSHVARKINNNIGKIWHQQYENKDYGNGDFRVVENIYGETRDGVVNLLDIENLAERLKNFIGRTEHKSKPLKNKWGRTDLLALGGLVIAIVALAFGDNLVNRIPKAEKPLSTSNNSTKTPLNKRDTTILSKELPYLESYPIIDKGLYVKYYFNDLLFGGVNLDTVRLNARAVSGEALNLKREADFIIMDITKEPYIEFEYKGRYYSIEIRGQHYSFSMILREIDNLTMGLKQY